ncbi:hypothetical protein IMX26_07440 [Clostridium sp. 'deep sea']|uniref:phosphotransferase n=1 Tax=Clostridium sp. 'deep sea' TaxID=2779445 RepID=UPI0018969E67|nr:phosphotransferase [Clostridium sp. 'deep sea']QOR36631.1 hypothetical protein IMX26_07440 [Clostridium sp. 'deep sea']
MSIVEHLYDLTVLDFKVLKPNRVIKLITNKGLKVLKKWNTDLVEIQYNNAINFIMQSKLSTVNILININNQRYFLYETNYYYLYDFIDGSNISSSEGENVLQAINSLALMHKHMQNLTINILDSKIKYDRLPKKIKGFSQEFETLNNQVKTHQSEVSNIFLNHYSYYKEQAIKGNMILPTLNEHLIYCQKVKQLCHGDSGLRNFIKSDSGIYIIDLESFQYNTVIYDLIKFIKSLKWNTELIGNCLASYVKRSGYSNSDIILLLNILNIPFEFISYTTQYLKTGLDIYRLNLQKFIDYEDQKKSCISHLIKSFSS